MREVSPAVGISVDEWLQRFPELAPIVSEIRRQKQTGTRLRPSTTVIERSSIMTRERRAALLDRVAALVDENYVGRSEMCLQFAALLHRGLLHLQFPSRGVVGTAIYYDAQKRETFRWRHAWVRIGEEIIDGNVDCLAENPLVPKTVRVAPYWGSVKETPPDRRLNQDYGASLPADEDVDKFWWPDLKDWLDRELLAL